MIQVFKKWIARYFADEEAITLLIILAAGLLTIIYAGDIIAPILASVIIAYLLQGLVQKFSRWMPQAVSVALTFLLFAGGFLVSVLLVVPIIGRQVSALVKELPVIASKLQVYLIQLQKEYPEVLSQEQIQGLISIATQKAGAWGETILSFSLASLPNIFAIMVYGVLIPLMVFFFLKDKDKIIHWLTHFLPDDRPLMNVIWQEMNMQVANYARGKAVEVLLVGGVTYITFTWMGLNYAALLALLVGLSVIIPYIGAVVVTVPVVAIAFFQWGMTDSFGYVLLAYGIIQFLDGNVLVPFLFSEAVNMHPVAIIVAVLVFGGLWGLWGVFFAIPLATLIKALLEAWPRGVLTIEQEHEQESVCE